MSGAAISRSCALVRDEFGNVDAEPIVFDAGGFACEGLAPRTLAAPIAGPWVWGCANLTPSWAGHLSRRFFPEKLSTTRPVLPHISRSPLNSPCTSPEGTH